MLRKEIISKMLSTNHGGAAVFRHRQQRWMVGKAPNRAAVHGTKLPVPNIIPEEEMETEIIRTVDEKEKQRKKMKNIVDSHLKKWKVLFVEEIVSSKLRPEKTANTKIGPQTKRKCKSGFECNKK